MEKVGKLVQGQCFGLIDHELKRYLKNENFYFANSDQ